MSEPIVEQPGERPDGEPREGGLRAYIGRHWRGENPLIYAFWVNYFALGILVQIISSLLERVAPDHGAWAIGMIALIIAEIAFVIWAMVGVWRSAGREIDVARQAQPPRSAFWAYVARVWIGFTAVMACFAVLYVFAAP